MEWTVSMAKPFKVHLSVCYRFQMVANMSGQLDIISLFHFFASELLSDAHVTDILPFTFSHSGFDKQ